MLEIFSVVGELLGGIGALAALAYLAIQIRHSNTLANAQSRQTLLDTFSQLNWEIARDNHMAEVISKGLQCWPNLSNSDKTTFDLAMGRYISNLHNGLLLMEEGMLDQNTFDTIADNLLICIPTPGGGKWWKETGMVPPIVRDYINQRLVDSERLPGSFADVLPHWYALARPTGMDVHGGSGNDA
jgi:hypothetical protein